MSNDHITNKERLVKVETIVELMSVDVAEIKKCIVPLKIKVYTGAGLVAFVISAVIGYIAKFGV